MVEGILGSLLSKSNVINIESKGSMTPSAASNYFHCGGHFLSTTSVDMDIGDWAKSSMML